MVTGKGHTDSMLTETDIVDICAEAFEVQNLGGKKVLVIIPDHSRTAPIDILFRTVYKLLAARVECLLSPAGPIRL